MSRLPSSAAERNDPAANRELALMALQRVAASKALDHINYGDIAAEAGLPWQTVKRLLGPREQFSSWLNGEAQAPDDTRSQIIEASARVFARKGYLGASLDEVAADAGMTKGAVYWHFSSKQELFFALLDSRFQQEYDEHLPPAMAAHASNPDAKVALKELLHSVIARIEGDPDWPRLFLEFMGQAREPEVRSRLGQAYESSYRMSASMISQMSQGELNSDDAELQAIFWTALMDGLIMAWLINPLRIDLPSLMPRIVDMLWQGLAPRQQ